MELDELQIGYLSACPERQGHAVAGRHGRVRGGGVDLTEAAAGQDNCTGVRGANAVSLALAEHVQRDPGSAAVAGEQQIQGEGMLDDLKLGTCARLGQRREQRTGDLRAGRVTASVRDAAAQMSAFPGERER